MKQLRISVDFDGTVVTNNYPQIGRLMNGAKETINEWYNDHIVTISTCRSGAFVGDCVDFLHANGIKYHFINENDPELIKQYGMDTRKISADIYVDDRNQGGFIGWAKTKEYVDWKANHKPAIICIVGASGSGKTTLSDYIELTYGIKMIESRTTRPKRSSDETGHTFVTDEEFDTYSQGDMLAYTTFGDYRYCCLKEDVRELNTYVLDEFGLQYLKEHFSDVYDIKTILVTCNETDRRKRVGDERVDRDKGRFNMPAPLFDFVWRTDDRLNNSYNRPKQWRELNEFIEKTYNLWS